MVILNNDALRLEAIGHRALRKYSKILSIITANFKDFDANGRPPTAAKGAMSVSSLTTDTDIAFHSPAPVSFSGEGDA